MGVQNYGFIYLQQTLDNLKELARQDTEEIGCGWPEAFYELLDHINSIIIKFSSISENKDDPEMLGI